MYCCTTVVLLHYCCTTVCCIVESTEAPKALLHACRAHQSHTSGLQSPVCQCFTLLLFKSRYRAPGLEVAAVSVASEANRTFVPTACLARLPLFCHLLLIIMHTHFSMNDGRSSRSSWWNTSGDAAAQYLSQGALCGM